MAIVCGLGENGKQIPRWNRSSLGEKHDYRRSCRFQAEVGLMKAECVITNGALLPARYSALGFTAHVVIALKVGRIYEVYGTSVWHSIVSFLVMDEDESPSWYPAEVFKIVDDTVPDNWFFKYFSDDQLSLQAVWGPERLVKEEGFYEALADGDPTAVHTFRTELSSR